MGLYANLFGHKTRFFFLWQDIEDIQLLPPSLASVGSPLLVIILKKDRGLDARHGAKSQDEEGRLRFCFQSFVSFNVASRWFTIVFPSRFSNNVLPMSQIYMTKTDFGLKACCIGRTIMALWRTRTLTPEQKAQIAEEQEDQEEKSIMVEENEIILDAEDAKMSKVYGAELPIDVSDYKYATNFFFTLVSLLCFQASSRNF